MRASITLTIAAFLATLAPAKALAQEPATHELRMLEGFPFTVYHSSGQEERARDMAQLCLRTMEHMDDLLGFRPEVELKVLLPDDWSAHTNFPVYGMPHYTSQRTLVMAAVNNAMWDSFIPDMGQLPAEVASEVRRVYGTPDGGVSMQPFFDLLVIHELGHAYHMQKPVATLRQWMGEQFCNIFLHTFIAEQEPARLDALTLMPRVVIAAGTEGFAFTTLQQLEDNYNEVGARHPRNYGWYQCRWHKAAADIHDEAGDVALRRLWAFLLSDPGKMDDDELARRLESEVHPAVARVMTDW
ncbi:MAG: hypothetical protein KF905_09390 [Flavobacteriales bacterium]|nr:hypothetical protein [Flavobacteriales bacterium]